MQEVLMKTHYLRKKEMTMYEAGMFLLFVLGLSLPFSFAIGTYLEQTVPDYYERALVSTFFGILSVFLLGFILGFMM